MSKIVRRACALAPVLMLLNFGAASALPLAPMPAIDAPVAEVACKFNGPNCVTGKYPDMQQEYRNEAGYGLENPGCQGDCNQFGFIPDAKKGGVRTGPRMPIMRRLH
jgi:hypothetical protein